MVGRLVMTSVADGLGQGPGFQPVLRTRGMLTAVAERLRLRSGYSHPYPFGDPRNPEIFFHRIESVAGQSLHVLARIRDAGADHDGRSNRLSEFLVLDEADCHGRPAGPAFAMQRFVWLQELSSQSREIDERIDLPGNEPGDASPTDSVRSCDSWATMTGDAGWAGQLARSFVDGRTAVIMCRPGDNVLSLFVEAMWIVPPAIRWQVTFITCEIEPVPAIWRAWRSDLPAGRSRPDSAALVIDLAEIKATGRKAGDDSFCRCARGEVAPPWRQSSANRTAVPPVFSPVVEVEALSPSRGSCMPAQHLAADTEWIRRRRERRQAAPLGSIGNERGSTNPTAKGVQNCCRTVGLAVAFTTAVTALVAIASGIGWIFKYPDAFDALIQGDSAQDHSLIATSHRSADYSGPKSSGPIEEDASKKPETQPSVIVADQIKPPKEPEPKAVEATSSLPQDVPITDDKLTPDQGGHKAAQGATDANFFNFVEISLEKEPFKIGQISAGDLKSLEIGFATPPNSSGFKVEVKPYELDKEGNKQWIIEVTRFILNEPQTFTPYVLHLRDGYLVGEQFPNEVKVKKLSDNELALLKCSLLLIRPKEKSPKWSEVRLSKPTALNKDKYKCNLLEEKKTIPNHEGLVFKMKAVQSPKWEIEVHHRNLKPCLKITDKTPSDWLKIPITDIRIHKDESVKLQIQLKIKLEASGLEVRTRPHLEGHDSDELYQTWCNWCKQESLTTILSDPSEKPNCLKFFEGELKELHIYKKPKQKIQTELNIAKHQFLELTQQKELAQQNAQSSGNQSNEKSKEIEKNLTDLKIKGEKGEEDLKKLEETIKNIAASFYEDIEKAKQLFECQLIIKTITVDAEDEKNNKESKYPVQIAIASESDKKE